MKRMPSASDPMTLFIVWDSMDNTGEFRYSLHGINLS